MIVHWYISTSFICLTLPVTLQPCSMVWLNNIHVRFCKSHHNIHREEKPVMTNKGEVWRVKICSGSVFYLPTLCNFLTAGAVAVNFQWGKPMLSVPACLLFWRWRERRKSFLIFIKNDSAAFLACQHFQSWWRSRGAAGRAIQHRNWEFKTKAATAWIKL